MICLQEPCPWVPTGQPLVLPTGHRARLVPRRWTPHTSALLSPPKPQDPEVGPMAPPHQLHRPDETVLGASCSFPVRFRWLGELILSLNHSEQDRLALTAVGIPTERGGHLTKCSLEVPGTCRVEPLGLCGESVPRAAQGADTLGGNGTGPVLWVKGPPGQPSRVRPGVAPTRGAGSAQLLVGEKRTQESTVLPFGDSPNPTHQPELVSHGWQQERVSEGPQWAPQILRAMRVPGPLPAH